MKIYLTIQFNKSISNLDPAIGRAQQRPHFGRSDGALARRTREPISVQDRHRHPSGGPKSTSRTDSKLYFVKNVFLFETILVFHIIFMFLFGIAYSQVRRRFWESNCA